MYQFSCFILNFVFLTVSAAVFACASTVSSGPVGQASIDDVERVFFGATFAALAVLSQPQRALARCVWQAVLWLPASFTGRRRCLRIYLRHNWFGRSLLWRNWVAGWKRPPAWAPPTLQQADTLFLHSTVL